VVWVADDLGAWLVALLADAGRKKLTALVLGDEQERALRQSANVALRRTATELSARPEEHAGQLFMVLDQVFTVPARSAVNLGQSDTMLEDFRAGIAAQLAPLADPDLTGAGESAAGMLAVPADMIIDTLTGHLLGEIITRGASDGPLAPLANQFNHDMTHLQNRQITEMVNAVLQALGRLESGPMVTGPGEVPREVTWPHRTGVVPIRAHCWQHRAEADLLTASLLDTSPAGSGVVVLTPVLSGLGGVGKTQLAAGCAEEMFASGQVDLLLWVTAASRADIEAGYAHAAAEVTGFEDADTVRGAARFLAWLAATDRRWLIVLDDLAAPADLAGLWPPSVMTGRTIITTRRRDAALTGPGRKLLSVGLFSPAEAAEYLTARLADRPQLLEGAQELASDLGYLPLALAQAAAYSMDRELTCAQYRARLADRRHRLDSLLPEPDALPDAHRATVAATWSLSVELANRLAPRGLARPLLRIAAALDPNGIPARVFTTAAILSYLANSQSESGRMANTTGVVIHGQPRATARPDGTISPPSAPMPGYKSAEIAADQAQDGLHCLARLNLVTLNERSDARRVRIHALVQRATRETLTDHNAAEVARTAAEALLEAWPPVEQDPGLGQALRSNAEALTACYPEMLSAPQIHPLLFRTGRSLGEAGSVTAAVSYFPQMTNKAVELLGRDHPDTLTARHELALWRGQAGDAATAAAAYEALLADRLRVLGPEHPDTLATRGNLAWWTGRAGNAAAAAAAFEQLLADQLQILGQDHHAILTTRHNLAYWLAHAGRIAEATLGFEHLLADQRASLGPDHPDALNVRNCLACQHGYAGNAARAVAELEDLMSDRLRVLGPHHRLTLVTRHNLARWQGEAGDATAAATAFSEIAKDRERILGPDHPHTLNARSELARWHGVCGDPDTAATEYRELLADRLQILGPDHPDTLAARHHLARWQGEAGDPSGAADALEELLADRIRVHGPDHPLTMTTRSELIRWRDRSGHSAGEALQALLKDRVRVLGPQHPDTLQTRYDLAQWRASSGDRARARAELHQLLTDRIRILGPQHPRTHATRKALAGDSSVKTIPG
jgi:NB-ARC domain/Tetratricopeptide repeat